MASEKAPQVEMELLRDYWPEEDRRVPAGTILEVPMEAAMDLIEKGLAQRVKKA